MPRKPSKTTVRPLADALGRLYPDAVCTLDHRNAFELLVATVLSAQSTDARVNLVTPALFARCPNAGAMDAIETAELEEIIKSTGFFRAKSKHLKGLARALVTKHGGEVPNDLDALVALPGVGRKTANVVLGNAFGVASGFVVDTHVGRLARRLGLSKRTAAEKVEEDLMKLFPPEEWVHLSHRLIAHGRAVCAARKPRCDRCELATFCPRVGVP